MKRMFSRSLLLQRTLLMGIGFAPLFCAVPGRADQAVVVGIDQYQNLRESEWLQGCVNDAELMSETFANKIPKRHFTVHMLTNAKATHANILKALDDVRKQIKPDERFVFYFAGHGANRGWLLDYDAQRTGVNSLTREELKSAVAAIPAYSRTVILDACFSESLIATKGIDPDNRTRSFRFEGMPDEAVSAANATKSLDDSTRGDAPAVGAAPDKTAPGKTDAVKDDKDNTDICYWSAALRTERANESTLPDLTHGTKHGVFTYYAAQQLTSGKATWGDVNSEVRQLIQKARKEQRPVTTESYTGVPIFESKTRLAGIQDPQAPQPPVAPAPKPRIQSVWDAFNHVNSDPKMLTMTSTPADAVIDKNQKFEIEVQGGFPGYLLVIEMNDKGLLHLAWPDNGKVEDSVLKDETGQPHIQWNARMDDLGRYQVRTILLRSREQAEALIKAFPPKKMNGDTLDPSCWIDQTSQPAHKSLFLQQKPDADPKQPVSYFTADLLFLVRDPQAPKAF